jgi:hypothetical protein
MSKTKVPTKRRIFLRSKDRVCQIFTFTQSSDGSIYCASPDFSDAKWISVDESESDPRIITTESIGLGKVSFHASGMVAVRKHSDEKDHQLVIKGNHLFDQSKNAIGLRHLFTIFLKEPNYYPVESRLFNRESDYCLEANEELKPLVLGFFAIPQINISLNFQFNLHTDDMVNIPNDILGMHSFSLRYHNVLWFAYRTKHMENWPKYAHICYHNGYTFPVFIGTANNSYRLEFRTPTYFYASNGLVIDCNQVYPEDYSNP